MKRESQDATRHTCSRPCVEGSGLCVLHLPRKSKGKDTAAFNSALASSIAESTPLFSPYYPDRKKGIDFHGIISPYGWDARSVLKEHASIPLYFEHADLRGSTFNRLDLHDSSFYSADLRKCDFFGVDLSNCDLKYADFRGAILKRSVLKGAISYRLKYNRLTDFSFIDASSVDWSYNQDLRQDISLYQRMMQLRAEKKALFLLWDVFGDCGRSLWIVFRRSLEIMLLFGSLFLHYMPASESVYDTFVPPFIYSATSFTGISYALPFSTQAIQLLAATEGLLGLVMLAILIAMFLSRIQS
jgi:hypothetical protein